MMLIKYHLCKFTVEYILDNSDRLASSGIPNLDVSLTSYKDLHTFLTETCTTDCLVVGELRLKRFRILEDSEDTGSSNEATMLWDSSDTLDFVCIGHIEGLLAAVIEDVPQLNDTFGICSYERVKIRQAVDSNQRVLVAV